MQILHLKKTTDRVRRLGRPLAAAALLSLLCGMTPATASDDAIVGVWVVKAADAPFPYHMFVFNADGTMQQANPDMGDENTSDSDGKGIWASKDGKIVGKFVEITADRATHKFASRGEISYEIAVSGETLTGTATAKFYDENDKLQRGPFPTPLTGKRVTLP
ncbi:hypothetical protein [Rhizobium sp. RAF56]|jgi:hypothetical protein|uniref:hypothetical protein n=1 Tax=Rhizobium sp. RAF56 TaxID=3233062 RepID=UPI003F9CC505